MKTLLVTVVWIGTLVAVQPADGQNSGAAPASPVPASASGGSPKRAEPCYVVIALDVSGSMENDDGFSMAPAERAVALRDEGQLIFLQLLPFFRSDLYLGITHFSDRVRYAMPSRETGPLLPWGQTFLNEPACRNLVKPAQLHGAARSDVAEGLSWAADRIQAARQQYGQGPAKVILLSNGDRRASVREMDRGRGPVLSAAKQLAEQQIQIYPVLIATAPSGRALAIEGLMHSIALMTGGRTYRLDEDLGFADILMDIFDLGAQVRGDLLVSRHDWAIVAVGAGLASLSVEPPDGGAARPRVMALDSRLEGTSGIRASLVSSPRFLATVLRRPVTGELVDRYWQGRWTLGSPDEKSRSALRIYRIPDCLVQLEAGSLPWWLNEQVQLKAHLLDRHRETPESQIGPAADGGRGLSIHMKASLAEEQGSFTVDRGRWAIPGRLYESEPFVVRAPGLYKLTGELRHAVGSVNVPVLHFTSDLYVHPECVGLEVVNAATNDVLREAPPTAATLAIKAQGGQQVYFRIRSKGEFKVEPMSGVIHLEPPARSEWALHKDEAGNLVTDAVPLIEQEEQLTGWVDMDVRTFAGVRHLRLPTFELAYTPAPMRIACAFSDPRDTLWVGELHRQPLTISVFPVFDRFRDQALKMFPETLEGMRLRTIDLRSGTMQVMGPENRLLERPQPGGPEGRTVAATYFIESMAPIPPADKCEIDLGGVAANLQGVVKTYGVVDPAAKGIFEWVVQQGDSAPRSGPVAETLYCGEPIRFFTVWRSDQNVSAVRFEIPRPNGADSIFVDLPVAAGSHRAQVEQVVPGLVAGGVQPIYVHVTMQPAGADHPLHIKLKGGQFHAEDRRIILDDLTVGGGTPADLPAYVWEPMEIPVQATFRGYQSDNLSHSAVVEQFKKSCVVTVTPRTGAPKNITDTLEWTSVAPVKDADKTCRLTGRLTYTPEVLGRAAIELAAETPMVREAAGSAARRAYVHVLAKEPRVTIAVSRLKPGGDEPIFDSRNWVKGQAVDSPLTTRLSTRLRVDIRSLDWGTAGPSQPWKTTVRLLRRSTPNAEWVTAFSEAGRLSPNETLTREIQIAENGQYALEMVGQDGQSNRRTVYVLTPIIASIQPHEVRPVLAPPTWLTSRVRQWPFEYQVTLHQDAVDLSRPQALAFQFQLPGQSEVWLDGATLLAGPETGGMCQLSVKSPRLLPPSRELHEGVARFRLSAQGLEVLRWECPNVRVLPPILEGLTLSRESGGAALTSNNGMFDLDGSSDLWVRPRFRVAPEIEGQWTASKTVVYLWPDSRPDAAALPVDVRILERLQQGTSDVLGSQSRIFEIENGAGVAAVKALPRHASHRFWGWPRKAVDQRYSLVASVVYRPQGASDSSGAAPADRTVIEWSDVYPIHLAASWVVPLCWWPLGAAVVMAALAMALRVLVPSPSRLALDMRLEDNVAVVEPVRLDNPVLVDLRETRLAEELVLYTRYLCSRWNGAGRKLAQRAGLLEDSRGAAILGDLLQAGAVVAGPVRVLLRRCLYPRRWAWATVIPRIRGNTDLVRSGLLCVWTGLGARRGRVWSSQAGSSPLPPEGQTKSIHLDLPYRIDSVDRTMRVTVRVRRKMTGEIMNS